MTTFAADLYLLVAAYGLAIAVSYAGLPVLGHGAFVSIGAFGTTLLAAHGLPLGVAVVASVAMAGVAGYLVGFAAARLDGAPLALATWALAWLGYLVLVEFPAISGGSQGLTRATPARLVSHTLGVAVTLQPWVHVVIAGLTSIALAVVLWRSTNGPWGLDWMALRTGPVLADSLGVPVQRRRRAVLAATAAIGAVGGAGTAVLLGVVSPPDYSPLLSLQLFVAVLIGGSATWWGPAIGIALLAALPSTAHAIATVTHVDPLRMRAVLTAFLLVAALALRRPVSEVLRKLTSRWRWFRASRALAHSDDIDVTARARSGVELVRLTNVTASYDAVRALDGVDLTVVAGEVHALIGPNGSGKSTALRAITGAIGADGVVATGDGVVRTFQRTVTLPGVTARAQVAVGARAQDREAFLGLRHLFATPAAQAAARRRAAVTAHALAVAGIPPDHADVPADRLDSAEQRLLQIARAIATGVPALLLDEPAAGMSSAQRSHLVDVIAALAWNGNGVLLVEHDMALIARVAHRVTVLAAGRVLATGAPAAVRKDPAVVAAYLGDHA